MESRINRPKYFVPPAVSICFPYLQLINYTSGFHRLPKLKGLARRFIESTDTNQRLLEKLDTNLRQNYSFREAFYDDIHEKFTIKQILSTTLGLDSVLKRCLSLMPGSYSLEPCGNIYKYQSYVKDDLKCFQFVIDRKDGENSKFDLQQIYYWQYPDVFLFRLNFVQIDPNMYRMVIFIHPSYRKPSGRTDIPLQIDFPTRKLGYNITFSRTLNQLLPAPFRSDCHDYRDSRNEEIDRCIQKEATSDIGKVPPWILLKSDVNVKTLRQSTISGEDFHELIEITKKCSLKFSQPDCYLEEFTPELLVSKKGDGTHYFGIDVNLPTSLDVENKLKPAQTLIGLFVYAVSVLGFWFGLHAAAIFRVGHKIKKILPPAPKVSHMPLVYMESSGSK